MARPTHIDHFVIALLGALVWTTASSEAQADVRAGDCPDAGRIRAALADVGVTEDAGWSIETRTEPDALVLRLEVEGLAETVRRLPAADCEELARVVAFIVERRLRERPDPPPPPPEEALERGLLLTLHAIGHRAPGAALEVALALAGPRWRLDVGVSARTPWRARRQGETLRLGAGSVLARVALGRAVGPRWWGGAVGAGLGLVYVRARDVPGARARWRTLPELRVGPVVEGGEGTLRWRLGLELRVPLWSERYRVEPAGAIERTPHVGLRVAFGLRWTRADNR